MNSAMRNELEMSITAAQAVLSEAILNLAAFEQLAENNVFENLEDADMLLEDRLALRAFDDCQGAYNCGEEEYRQAFMVDGIEYVAIYTPEYDRHDKMYYYIDSSEFRIEKK